jgi:hypothetical protein
MSALCQFQTHAPQQITSLFDHLVGDRKYARPNEAERLGSLEVDHELELGRLQDRQVAGLGTLENAVRINASLVHGVPSRPPACRGVCRKTDQQLPARALEVMGTVTLSFEVNNRRARSRRACVIHITDEPAVHGCYEQYYTDAAT